LPDKLALIASVLEGRIGVDATELKEIEADEHLRNGPDASRFVGSSISPDGQFSGNIIDEAMRPPGQRPRRFTPLAVPPCACDLKSPNWVFLSQSFRSAANDRRASGIGREGHSDLVLRVAVLPDDRAIGNSPALFVDFIL
jgi:hypothetical protein